MNVPKLRFKEFDDEWDYKIFDELINIKSESYNPSLNKENYKCIELEHINQNTGTINGYCNSQDQKSNKNIFKKNEVLFGKLRPYLKKYWYATFDGVCSSEIWVGKSKDQNIVTNKFIYDLFQSHYFLQLCNLSTGSKMPRADWPFIKEQSIAIPNILEQKKISETLELLDKKIELQSKKVEDLKLFKKGLSNNIFNNMKDFKEYKLGDLCNITTGKLDANAMVENGKYRFYTCAKEYSFIDEYSFDTEALLISGNGAYVGYIHYYNGKFNAYQRTYVLDQFSQNIQFIKCYLDENLSRRIKSEKKEGNTPYIVLSTLSDMIIKVPSKENQRNISNIINYHQRKILLEQNKLNKLKELKKGLMQKMFV
jgi:type I restriction enzyme, S subunit